MVETVIGQRLILSWLIQMFDGGRNEGFKGSLNFYCRHSVPPSGGEKVVMVVWKKWVRSDKIVVAICSVLDLYNCSRMVSGVQHIAIWQDIVYILFLTERFPHQQTRPNVITLFTNESSFRYEGQMQNSSQHLNWLSIYLYFYIKMTALGGVGHEI